MHIADISRWQPDHRVGQDRHKLGDVRTCSLIVPVVAREHLTPDDYRQRIGVTMFQHVTVKSIARTSCPNLRRSDEKLPPADMGKPAF